jgi:glycosyltransferase involved in cell wall biosynthesis
VSGRRVAVVASEVLGVPRTGGPGTADSLLALALGRSGHQVELLVAPGREAVLGAGWERMYRNADVRVRPLTETERVRPDFLAPAAHVYEALHEAAPEVVVADDWRALAYAALRARQLGSALQETAFVLYCHGPARVFAAAARKVPDTVARYGEEIAQRACVELADAVVSPSRWLLDWMRDHNWPLHDRVHVIQNLWESTALGVPPRHAAAAAPIRRLAFFGQIREGKGIRVYLDALRQVEPRLLEGVELLFLGHTRTWTAEQLREELGRPVRLETELDRTAAVDELMASGTLAVMPSLLENSPYAVAECVEHGIPFLASNVGGTPELVAADDRARVLCDPTAGAFAEALTRVLGAGQEPARPARDPGESLAAWLDLVATVAPRPKPSPAHVDRSEWTVIGDGEQLLETLLAAQAASGADAVTVGVRAPDGSARLFLGDPGALGLIENQYGVTGIVRRSDPGTGSPWLRYAQLAARGARIVSLPEALATYDGPLEPTNADRLAVLEVFEQADPALLRELPQLTATLGAALARSDASAAPRRLGRIRRRLLG